MARSAVILIENEAVALIRREVGGRVHYLFPGGKVEEGETPEQAAAREALEDLGVSVQIDQLAAEVTYRGNIQTHYLARSVAGRFGTGTGDEVSGKSGPASGTYLPVWVPVCRMLELPVYPRGLCQAIADAAANGWPTEPLRMDDPGRPRAD